MTIRSRKPSRVVAIVVLLLSFIGKGLLHAQPMHDSKGKEFWVTFMENAGSGGLLEVSQLRLYLSSHVSTTVRITYFETNASTVIQLPTADVPVEVNINKVFADGTELAAVRGPQNEISRKAFHILAEEDITLYGINIRGQSADAFLGLPDDALTGDYIALGYTNGSVTIPSSSDTSRRDTIFDTNSEFAVVGTEDGTTVTISPSCPLVNRPDVAPFTVQLNRGQVFFAQAVLGTPYDISGSRIRANKPVAVFAGNERTSVPTTAGSFRDHLVEQMPPVQSWGSTALLAPHFTVTPSSPYIDSSIARVMAAFDGTECSMETSEGTQTFTLNAGRFIELTPLRAATIKASGPILAAQYEHSVMQGDSTVSGNQAGIGDPFMMLIPPIEQHDTTYAFQSVAYHEFIRHFINVVCPVGAVASLRLDGNPVNTPFAPIPGSSHAYAQIELGAGSHTIRADSAFGLYVYGFGRATSYGYTGGTLFRALVVDFERPVIVTRPDCGGITGIAVDDRIADWGIDSCYVLPSGTTNIDATIPSFIRGSDSVFFTARLRDPYRDGTVTVKAVDSAGRSATERRTIPGYTLRATEMSGSTLQTVEMVSYNGKTSCREIEIVNDGLFPQRVDRILMNPAIDGISATPSGMALEPGERKRITICYESYRDSVFEFTLAIGDTCIDRTVAAITIHSIVDTLSPTASGIADRCDQGIEIFFEDEEERFHGIASVETIELINAQASFTPPTDQLPRSQLVMRLNPVDERADVVYEVRMTDLAGNITTVRDTIGGFTFAAFDPGTGARLSIEQGDVWTSDSLTYQGKLCDSIILVNYGHRPLVIDYATLAGNREFSIPPSQFPLTLNPKDSTAIAICLQGDYAGNREDTLVLIDTCGRPERIALQAPIGFGLGYGIDKCGQQLTIQAYAPAKQTFLTTPFPNPSTGESISIDIGLDRDDTVTTEIFDMKGNLRLRVLERAPMPGGVHRLRFESSFLSTGTYLCRMTTGGQRVHTAKFVVKR